MIVRRRSIISIAFLVGAILFASADRASAQQSNPSSPGRHDVLPGNLTPDQLKSALERFSKGPELPPELLNLLKERMERDGNKVDEQQIKNALELMQKNPELRRQVEDMSRKFRNNGGKHQITPEERQQLDKLAPQIGQMLPQNPNGGPFGPPKAQPPRNVGNPPIPGQENPPPPPKNAMQPMQPDGAAALPLPPPQGNPELNPNQRANPFEPNDTPRDKANQVIGSLWERNIGPLSETPAVRDAIFGLTEGTEDLRDSDGKSFWDSLSKDTGESTSFADFLDGASGADSWNFPKFDLPSMNWGAGGGNSDTDSGSPPRDSWWKRLTGDRPQSSPSAPRSSSGAGGFSFGVPGLKGLWLAVVPLAVLLIGFLLWRFWSIKQARAAAAFSFGGPGWPVDPRRITTREHVVLAFEYLSVLICGPTAKTWTHNTIAEALSELAATHGETAVMLARLYELARYAPLDEPLTTAELAEARRLICSLAGMENE